jgi:hypothetical protein
MLMHEQAAKVFRSISRGGRTVVKVARRIDKDVEMSSWAMVEFGSSRGQDGDEDVGG